MIGLDTTYADIPFYRKQWFFWISLFLVFPITFLIIVTGDVYYEKNNELKKFGIINRVIIGIVCIFALMNILS